MVNYRDAPCKFRSFLSNKIHPVHRLHDFEYCASERGGFSPSLERVWLGNNKEPKAFEQNVSHIDELYIPIYLYMCVFLPISICFLPNWFFMVRIS